MRRLSSFIANIPRSSRPWLWALGLVLIVVALGLSTGSWYETVDDAQMNALAAGQFQSSASDEHLIFTSTIIGFVLKGAYALSQNTPWYGLYLISSLALAMAAFLYAFAERLESWRGRVLVLAFLVGTIAATVTTLQFTRVAFLLVEAGWLMLASAVRAGWPRHRTLAVLGGALAVLGSLIRPEIGLLATAVCVPAVAIAVLDPIRNSGRVRVQVVGLIAAVLAVAGLFAGFDRAYYRFSPGWARFLEYQQLRTLIVDSGRIDVNHVPEAVLAHVDWSANDWSLLQNQFGLHSGVFSLERQRYVTSQTATRRGLFDPASIRGLGYPLHSPFLWLWIATTFAVIVIDGTWAGAAVVGLSVLAVVAVMAALATMWSLPPRFYEPALSVPAATALLAAWPARSSSHRRPPAWVSAAVCTVVALSVISAGKTLEAEGRLRLGEHQRLVEQVRQLDPDPTHLYVMWGGDFPFASLATPIGGFSGAPSLHAFVAGWTNFSPQSLRRLHEYHADDLYSALWKRSGIFLIAAPDRCQRLVQFIAVHYGQIVACDPVYPPLSVYSLKEVTVNGPSINIRLKESVSEISRHQFEEKYGLVRPRPLEAGTWRYELTDQTEARLLQLVRDDLVEDTAGIDRKTGRLVAAQPDW